MDALADVTRLIDQQREAARLAEFNDLMAGYTLPAYNPNALIPPQYSQPAQQTAPAPAQIGWQMTGLQPMNMYQNRNAYQSQYGTPDSLAPMQMFNQYKAGTPTTGAPTGTTPTGGK